MNVIEKTIHLKLTKENVVKITDKTENKLVNILVAKGDKGNTGKTGADGYTPVKGTDYYTEADKQEIVSLVLEALPSFEEVSY